MPSLKQLLQIGTPSAFQNLIVSTAFLVLIALGNQYGVNASAGMGIGVRINSFAFLPALAMLASVAAMSAQNIGAGQFERAKKTMISGMFLSLPIGLLFFAAAFFAPQALMKLFTNDPEVIYLGSIYLRAVSVDYVFVSFTFAFNGLHMGAGLTTFTMINAIFISLALRIPFAFLFSNVMGMGLFGIGLSVPTASVGGFIISIIYFKMGKWKKKRLV
jgi:Na+-driven multidrug efflux pump